MSVLVSPIEQPTATSGVGVTTAPLVTVVMTVYNGIAYVRDSVESILHQTLTDFEFIIVDDGSNDGTSEYVDSIDDPRVVVIHQQRAGQQAAAHGAILQAKASLIARMDSDDLSDPQRLDKQVRFLAANPDVGLVGSQITRGGEKGSGLLSHFPTDHDGIVADLMHNRHSMCNPATMFRRQLYFDIGGYWEHNIAEDWDMFLKIADIAKLANLDEPLLSYRFHTGSINGRRTVEAQLYNEFAAHQAQRRRAGLTPDTYTNFLANHRSQRFPSSFFFYSDCYSLVQYRKAVAEIHSGKPIRGRLRGLYSIVCSPNRMIRRVKSYVFGA